jgi:putative hydrolase of the HAD superfamily
VRAVILDYGGVVVRETPEDWDALSSRYGMPAGAAWAAFHDVPEYDRSRRGEISREAFRVAVLAAMARSIGEHAAARLHDEIQSLSRSFPPIEPEMEPLLRALRGRVRLGLLTNGAKGSLATLEARGVARRFDDVVASGDVGLAKPDPRVFRLAAERLGVEPRACAFVDDMERNVAGAREAGLLAHRHHRTRLDALRRFLVSCGALDEGPPPPAPPGPSRPA